MPTTDTSPDLQLLDTSASGGGCGCGGCGCGSNNDSGTSTGINTESPATDATQGNETTTNTYAVTGMTCGHCASAVTSELKSLDGVSDITVDLVADGTSSVTVTSEQRLDRTRVDAALEATGYTAAVPAPVTDDEHATAEPESDDRDREAASWRQRPIVSAVLTAPVLVRDAAPDHESTRTKLLEVEAGR